MVEGHSAKIYERGLGFKRAELHGCYMGAALGCRLQGQHDAVARASSAGTKSGSSARSLVLLTMLAPVSRTARFRDQLQLHSLTTQRSWEMRYAQ